MTEDKDSNVEIIEQIEELELIIAPSGAAALGLPCGLPDGMLRRA